MIVYAFLHRRTHMDFGEVFKREYQCVSSAPAMPECVDGLVELVCQREAWECEPHACRFFQSNPHVFDEMLDKKTWVEVALENLWRQIV